MPKQYASKAEAFNMGVYGDKYRIVRNKDGDDERTLEKEGLIIEFQPLIQKGTTYARALATRAFFPKSGWRFGSDEAESGHSIMGAIPSRHPMPMYNSGDNRINGMTEAYDPTLHFGFFDTAWITDSDRRAEAEKALDEHGLKGIEYIEIVAAAIPAPWPTYDEMRKGQGAHNAVLAFVKAGGIQPELVVEYETAQNDAKAGIVAAMEKLIAERDEAQVDEDALSVQL
jgi:hypothetical protein